MTKEEVIWKLKNELGYTFDDYMALVRVKHKNNLLPEIGANGTYRDKADWALISMAEPTISRDPIFHKNVYGQVYYFKEVEPLVKAL